MECWWSILRQHPVTHNSYWYKQKKKVQDLRSWEGEIYGVGTITQAQEQCFVAL